MTLWYRSLTRRQTLLLIAGLSGAAACRRRFQRPQGVHDIGEVKDLLYSKQFLRERALLVSRDDTGWSVMSTRCSYDGCELSYQDRELLCLCCRSSFNHSGEVINGPATADLPFYSIYYDNNHLFADLSETADRSYRFTTPEIEQAIGQLRERVKHEAARPGAKIPDVLLGGEENQEGMFQEKTETEEDLKDFQR